MNGATTSNKKRVGRSPQKSTVLDPYRKRSFDPDDKTAQLIKTWEERNPGTKFAWMANRAIEAYLASCLLKRGAS